MNLWFAVGLFLLTHDVALGVPAKFQAKPRLRRHDQFTIDRHGHFLEKFERPRHVLHRESIGHGRHHMQVRVYYEDTDFSGIVYHANYLRFMERGRTNHLRLLGAEQHVLFAEAQAETPGFAFVVRSMQIDFLKPARMDDILDVVTWPVAVKGASIMLAQEVRKAEEVLVKAEVRVAFISEGRAQPIPKTLRGLLRADVT